jgi:hypothetical protein
LFYTRKQKRKEAPVLGGEKGREKQKDGNGPFWGMTLSFWGFFFSLRKFFDLLPMIFPVMGESSSIPQLRLL